jgi:hypothetical protein
LTFVAIGASLPAGEGDVRRKEAVMAQRLLAWGSFVIVLVLVPVAAATQTVVSARAQITGSGTSYRLTAMNDGDRPILCFGLLLTGVQPTSASGPAGVLTRVGTFQGRGLVHMQGTAAAPVVQPGATVTVDFRTNIAIPTDLGGEIRYSDTCLAGSDQIGQASGPPPPPPKPKPQPKKCACKDLKTRIVPNRTSIGRSDARGFAMELLVEWTLTCTKGSGDCTGELTLAPSVRARRLGISVAAPAGTVACKGACAKTTTRFQRWNVSGGAKWAQGKRGRDPKLLRLEMKRKCKSTRIPQVFEIVFNRGGGIDSKLSDLNANGIQDGKD